jgi:hypothetical protein
MKTEEMNESFWEWFINDAKIEAWEPTAVTTYGTHGN